MPRNSNEVERKIHFFRAVVGVDDGGKPIPFKPKAAFEHIETLGYDDTKQGRYHEKNDNRYCLWADQAAGNAKVRLAVIRREGLPFVEENGTQTALAIPAAAGLVEQMHIRFFPNNIVGAEFNFYGPRMQRLTSYLEDKSDNLCLPVTFAPLLRQDAAEQLDGFSDIRAFHLRVRKSYVSTIEEADQSLGAAFRAAEQAGKADEIEVILRPEPHTSGRLANGMKKAAKALAGRSDIKEGAKTFSVEGYREGEAKKVPLDILGDAFITPVTIVKQDKRSRVVDSDSAFTEITTAYNNLKDDLEKAASIDP